MRFAVVSFNANNAPVTPEACEKLFAGIAGDDEEGGFDAVAVGLQECGERPRRLIPPMPREYFEKEEQERRRVNATHEKVGGDEGDGINYGGFLRGDEAGCEDLLSAVQDRLGWCDLAADVAMGEPKSKDVEEPAAGVGWYGFIRLLVFLRKGKYPNPDITTMVLPQGDKESHLCDKYGGVGYPPNRAPDKGVVAVLLGCEGLLLVNGHLCGTNKYCVSEAVFDEVRLQQLKGVQAGLEQCLPPLPPAAEAAAEAAGEAAAAVGDAAAGGAVGRCRLVLLGDLNFRVEVFSQPDAKEKGGQDFQAVVRLLEGAGEGGGQGGGEEEGQQAAIGSRAAAQTESATAKTLRQLYLENDRLRALMSEGGPQCPELLRGCIDCLGEALMKAAPGQEQQQQQQQQQGADSSSTKTGKTNGNPNAHAPAHPTDHAPALIFPTFTFRPNAPCPRRYNSKRTPSWTDRILLRGFRPRACEFRSVKDLLISDHEAVTCTFGLDSWGPTDPEEQLVIQQQEQQQQPEQQR